MIILTFFSEKGGVGKSSFTILFASWLQKNFGVKVGVADFNERIAAYRREEISRREKLRKDNPDIPPFDQENAWPIVTVRPGDIMALKKAGNQKPNATWLQKQIRPGGPLANRDIVLCDFPGSLSGMEFLDVAGLKMLNLIVIPTEMDAMTEKSTRKLHKILGDNYKHCVFLNKANMNLAQLKAKSREYVKLMTEAGYPMLPDIISATDRMGTIDKVDNIRSTFAYPSFENDKDGRPKDLGLGNLFIDVMRLLTQTQDLPGTRKTDLSFVAGLTKTPDDRQSPDSAFPEFTD